MLSLRINPMKSVWITTKLGNKQQESLPLSKLEEDKGSNAESDRTRRPTNALLNAKQKQTALNPRTRFPTDSAHTHHNITIIETRNGTSILPEWHISL